MKSPIFGKEKLLYFPQKSGILPIFSKSLGSYISYLREYTPWLSNKHGYDYHVWATLQH